ncbi:MAG: phosphonate metabolism protein PhnM [Rhodobacterales bacterium CG_4_10_14_0_8_um_filter_70_9]|nr:MAG: phosphonate metabolism protein PhnM [Rhodobacterales bacterium CG_4_10_14_0_8_um_filter_70_9]
MAREMVIANARVVTAEQVFTGAVQIRDGLIADVSPGARTPPGAVDCEGDYLIPGLVELHTDNLERHLHPRPGVQWPRRAAVAAHDGEFASVGVTTLLDALRVGSEDGGHLGDYAAEAAQAIAELVALGLLRADHHLHIRCELTSPNLIAEYDRVGDDPRVRLISLMDHTPGQRQFTSLDAYAAYYTETRGYTAAQMAAFIAAAQAAQAAQVGPNRAALLARAAPRGFAIASHDDATPAQVAESVAAGARVAEFPTTIEAARAARAAGQRIVMGAPNLLRGGSHAGNVSAAALAREGLLDILSSDYAPASLMLAAFSLAEDGAGWDQAWDLPRAIGCVTRAPALAAGFADRGAIAPGLRADLARVWHVERLCVVRSLWRAGARVL